ncbi:hypothetical protein [Clostridium polynesiense]|uniref:hypothetical protein n=1 Tax=Clostridium polynesiense TaxID=1325933 RepID=UPI00059082AF|nr:hypothetical protein [Clostridium polynesiense]
MIGIIASFGPARASNIFYPKILQSQRIYFGGFIEFGELYILIQIVANYFIKYIIAFYAFVIIYKNMFNKRPFAYYFISFVIFIASYAVSKNTIIFFSLLNFYSYLSFIGFIVIPFLTFTLLFLRGGKYDKNLPNT